MIDYKQAGQRIRSQRLLIGLTQETLSERIHITPSFYSQIETGTRKAGINTFLQLSQELSLSLDYILGNNVKPVTQCDLDDIEIQILYRIKKCSIDKKRFILDIIYSFEKYLK